MRSTKIILLLLLMAMLGQISYAKDSKKDSKKQKQYIAIITTDKGDITFSLLNETPNHIDNFII
ncbi:MAG: peptidylprolyl isomerase, partial [Rikenellaceae bacterium]